MTVLILTNSLHENFIWNAGVPRGDNLILIHGLDKKIDDWDEIEKIGGYDVGISFMYQHKVPAKEVNSHKWFNFHPAPLPEYKGRNLCYHAIMNGEKKFGASLHYMDENFDTGSILDVWHFTIEPYMTAEDVSRDAIDTAKAMFEEYFPQILAGEVFTTLPNTGGTYYKKEEIIEEVPVRPDDPFGQFVRAVTYKQFAPKINIGGVKYKIVREE